MAAFTFYGDETIPLGGSGLGFFGSSFGNSVEVGAYQDTTYITDGNGVVQGAAIDNTKWAHASSGIQNTIGTDPVLLTYIPNRLATLKINFTHSSAVKLQNTKLRIFDRSNINNPASGVTTKVAQLIHIDPTQGAGGSGDATWVTPAGSSTIMDLEYSPGVSGLHGTSTTWTDTSHDYFVVISASPDQIGAKTMFGLFVQTEYL